jgi:hypothetical protein
MMELFFGHLPLVMACHFDQLQGVNLSQNWAGFGYGHHFPNLSYSEFRLFVQVKGQITKLESS